MADKKPAAKAAPATVAVTAVEPITHDGVRYEPGEDLPEMLASQAQALIDFNAAKLAAPAA